MKFRGINCIPCYISTENSLAVSHCVQQEQRLLCRGVDMVVVLELCNG